jgi:hypothetical protein
MVGQIRAMLEAMPPDGRYRETVIDHSNMCHRSFGHVATYRYTPRYTLTAKGPISAVRRGRAGLPADIAAVPV